MWGFFELFMCPVLAEEAVEAASVEEEGEVVVSYLGPVSGGVASVFMRL